MAEMKTAEVPITEIFPYENNPRRNEKAVDAVMNSIKQFGFKNPIIVDENMIIVSGHTRRLAALKLGLKTVPVVIAKDLTEEQIRAFRLADNRVASFSSWNEEKLKQEISEINDIDLSDFGFKKDTIKEIFREKSEVKKHVCPKCGFEWKG
jgi:ParB/RepB/Spo0J family partition protein